MESIDLFIYSLIIILITAIVICIIYQILKCSAKTENDSNRNAVILPTYEKQTLIIDSVKLHQTHDIQKSVIKPKRNWYASNKVDEFIKLSITKSHTNIYAYCQSLKIILGLTITEKDIVTEEGAVPYFIKLFDDDWNLENVAACALSNLSSTKNQRSIQILINEGCIPALIKGINSSDYEVCRLSANAIANLRYKCDEKFHNYIDALLLPILISFLKFPDERKQIVAADVIHTVQMQIQWNAIILSSEVLPLLTKLLNSSNIEICKTAAAAIFSFTTKKPGDKTVNIEGNNIIIKHGALPYLVKLLNSSNSELCLLSTFLLANLCLGSAKQKQAVIDAQVLPSLVKLLSSKNQTISFNATNVIHNLTNNSTVIQKQAIIQAGALPYLIKNLNSNNKQIIYPTIIALTNIVAGTSEAECHIVLKENVIPALKKWLDPETSKYFLNALLLLNILIYKLPYAIENVIKAGIIEHLIQILNSNKGEKYFLTEEEYSEVKITVNDLKLTLFRNPMKLTHEVNEIYKRVIEIICQIASGTKEQRQTLIQCNVIPEIFNFLDSTDFTLYNYIVYILDIFEKNLIVDNDILTKTNSIQYINDYLNKINNRKEVPQPTDSGFDSSQDVQKAPEVIDL